MSKIGIGFLLMLVFTLIFGIFLDGFGEPRQGIRILLVIVQTHALAEGIDGGNRVCKRRPRPFISLP